MFTFGGVQDNKSIRNSKNILFIFFDYKITIGFLASTVELKGNLLDIELLVLPKTSFFPPKIFPKYV